MGMRASNKRFCYRLVETETLYRPYPGAGYCGEVVDCPCNAVQLTDPERHEVEDFRCVCPACKAYLRVEDGEWVREVRSRKEVMAARDAHKPQRLANPLQDELADKMEENREAFQRQKMEREASFAKADAERQGRVERAVRSVRSGVRRQQSFRQGRLFE